MPGYEREREKLRQYLGIEWVPNGLKEMDGRHVFLLICLNQFFRTKNQSSPTSRRTQLRFSRSKELSMDEQQRFGYAEFPFI